MPEVYGAVVGHNNRHIEELKLAWEPARFVAFVNWNVMVGRKDKMKREQELRQFPWEARIVLPGELAEVKRKVARFRSVWRDKWGLKYYGEK